MKFMKFDETYDKMTKSGWIPETCSKLDLALYFLNVLYSQHRELRYAGREPNTETETAQIEQPILSESIDISRDDVIEYLCAAGSTIRPFAGDSIIPQTPYK